MTYEYRCPMCRVVVEVQKKLAEMEREERCAGCNALMDRQVSLPAPPVFKGSGFYATDYKKKT